VHVLGEAVEEGDNMRRELRSSMKLGSQSVDLFLRWDLRGEKQPEQTFQERLAIALLARVRRKDLLALGDRQTTETNSLLRVEVGSLPQHALHTTGTADALIDGNLPDAVNGHKYQPYTRAETQQRRLLDKIFKSASESTRIAQQNHFI